MMKMRNPLIVIALIVTVTFTFVANVNAVEENTFERDYGMDLLPYGTLGIDWTLEDIRTGNMITFSSFEGKIILLDFFSASLGQSVNFAKELVDVRAEFSSSQLVMISVNIAPGVDTIQDIQTYITNAGITWHVVLDSVGMYTEYDTPAIPSFYLFNTDLRIVDSAEVITDKEYLINKINEYIDDVPTTTNTGPGAIPEFWAQNWYWFVIGGVFLIIAIGLTIQRVRVVNHNKKVREQRAEEKQKKYRQRNR